MSKGMIISFYSYKGGVGRTFALANVGALLSMWEYKVLCVDWDLEAPGLTNYLQPDLEVGMEVKSESSGEGVLELVEAVGKNKKPDWSEYIRIVRQLGPEGRISLKVPLSFMAAGIQDNSYIERLQSLDWNELYEKHGLGDYIEKMREDWKQEYDFILVDSRTGITDIGGISTVQLPDALVFFFTANNQSFYGAVDLVNRVMQARNELAYERGGLIALPVASRLDKRVEHELSKLWDDKFEHKVKSFYGSWVHRDVAPSKMLAYIRIPYVPVWSFGERLPVVEELGKDPESINYFFETLSALIAHRFTDTKELSENRDSFVSKVSKEVPSVGEVRAPRKREMRSLCSEIIERKDILAWRRLVDDVGREITDNILDWKPKGERAAHKGGEEWESAVLEVAEICLPGFVPIFVAVETGKKDFWKESVSTLRRLAMLKDKMGGGATWALGIGAHMLYVAGSLGMALAVETKQLDFVNDWMLLPIPNPDSDRHEQKPWAEIFAANRLPEGLKPRNKEPFKFLLKVSESDYLAGFFPMKERLVECLFLVNLLQSLVELRRCTESKESKKALEQEDWKRFLIDVFPFWCLMKPREFQSSTWDIFGSSKGVLEFVFPSGFVTPDKFWPWWKSWKKICGAILQHNARGFLFLHPQWLILPGEPEDEMSSE